YTYYANLTLSHTLFFFLFFFFFQAEDGIRDGHVTGVQTCALPISYQVAEVGAHGHPVTQVMVTLNVLGPQPTVFPPLGFHHRQTQRLELARRAGDLRLRIAAGSQTWRSRSAAPERLHGR